MARPKTDHNLRRDEIARAARGVILSMGLENAKLADIGASAGITTGAVQHYFRNKEELLLFVKNSLFDSLIGKMKEAALEHEGLDRLVAIGNTLLPIESEALDAYRVLEAFRGRSIGNDELLKIQHERDKACLAFLEGEIRRLQEAGDLPASLSARREALAFNALLDGLGAIVSPAPTRFDRADIEEIVRAYVLRLGK